MKRIITKLTSIPPYRKDTINYETKRFYILDENGKREDITIYDIIKSYYDFVNEDMKFTLVKSITRQVDNIGYNISTYRLEGTEDAFIIKKYDAGYSFYDIDIDNVEYHKDYFSKRKEYAKKCGKISRKHNIPFEVVLAIEYEYNLAVAMKKF